MKTLRNLIVLIKLICFAGDYIVKFIDSHVFFSFCKLAAELRLTLIDLSRHAKKGSYVFGGGNWCNCAADIYFVSGVLLGR